MLKYYHVIQVIYYPIIGTIIELIGMNGILIFSGSWQKAREYLSISGIRVVSFSK